MAVLNANDVHLYYEVEGDGPPLVLVHGWSLNLRMWDQQVPDFASKYQIIRWDRRGFGKSGGAEDPTWDADDLRLLLDHLGADRIHLLGMSQGATVALAFTLAFPNRVASLILHGPPAPRGFGLPWSGPDRSCLPEMQAAAQTEGIDAAIPLFAAHPLMDIPSGRVDAQNSLRKLLAEYRGGYVLTPTEPSGPITMPTITDLSRVAVPTMVIVGEHEVPYFRIVADALTYGIPGARKVVVPGGGHIVNLVEPALYNRAVLDFLATSQINRPGAVEPA